MPQKLNSSGKMQEYDASNGRFTSGATANIIEKNESVLAKEQLSTKKDESPRTPYQSANLIGNRKQQQLDIINKTNPMLDDYHTGIRSVEDIKTWDEVLEGDDDEQFVWGDFSREDAEQVKKTGKVKVYSSKPFEDGSFVSTSKNQARDYSGNGKIYEQEMDVNDVAWINGDEGQIAKVKNKANIIEKQPDKPKESKQENGTPYKNKVHKEFVDFIKEKTNIDLEKYRDTQFDNRNGFNIDTKKMNPFEFRQLQSYVIYHKNTFDASIESNGATRYYIRIKKK